MLVLGIETSCDETSIAIASGERQILSNIVVSSLHLHKRYGGIVPEIACRHHTELINFVLDKALKRAKIGLNDIDAISVTQGPGLIGALLVGISLAKALSYSLKIPIIPLNHLHGHLYAATINEKQVKFPSIGLIVSGGHTSLVGIKDIGNLKLLGQTRDDACGEAFDKVAKILGLGFPGGPIIEKQAKGGNCEKIKFPRSYLGKDTFDFSFSGIKTAVLYFVEGLKRKKQRLPVADICAGFQKAAFDMLLNKTRACCQNRRAKSLLIGGGVSANRMLRKRLEDLSSDLGIDILFPPKGMSLDNGAMIAGLGCYMYKREKFGNYSFTAQANLNF
jgi:N6-L-threonylcarbamoyladenine synthase